MRNSNLRIGELENLLENHFCFRDYSIVSKKWWTKINKARSMHVLEPEEEDVSNAIDTFCSDGYGTIIFYI